MRAENFLREPAPAGFRLGIHAFGKLNLGLWVGGKRPDGYHEIRTVFQTIDLADTLYLRPRRKGLRLRVRVVGPARQRGLPLGPTRSNLVFRAARELQRAANLRSGAELLLIKRIPAGSGLGGGSSDAVAALRGLARLWGLPPSATMVRDVALRMGSDCPFFVRGGRAVASGRGEHLSRLPVPMLHRAIVALPRSGVSTAQAYRLFAREKRLTQPRHVRTLRTPISSWHHHVTARSLMPNLLEQVVCRRHPEVSRAMELLERCGVSAVQMSGSGSAVFGLLQPGARFDSCVPMQPESSAALVLTRFARTGSRWTS